MASAELQEFGSLLSANSEDEIHRAVRVIASHAVDAAEARDLLEMVGLVEPSKEPRPRSGCGSADGWRRHQRNGTAACQPCLDAWAAYHRERGARGDE